MNVRHQIRPAAGILYYRRESLLGGGLDLGRRWTHRGVVGAAMLVVILISRCVWHIYRFASLHTAKKHKHKQNMSRTDEGIIKTHQIDWDVTVAAFGIVL